MKYLVVVVLAIVAFRFRLELQMALPGHPWGEEMGECGQVKGCSGLGRSHQTQGFVGAASNVQLHIAFRGFL